VVKSRGRINANNLNEFKAGNLNQAVQQIAKFNDRKKDADLKKEQ